MQKPKSRRLRTKQDWHALRVLAKACCMRIYERRGAFSENDQQGFGGRIDFERRIITIRERGRRRHGLITAAHEIAHAMQRSAFGARKMSEWLSGPEEEELEEMADDIAIVLVKRHTSVSEAEIACWRKYNQ